MCGGGRHEKFRTKHCGSGPAREQIMREPGKFAGKPAPTQPAPTWRIRTPRQELLLWGGWFSGLLVFLLCFKVVSDNTIWEFLTDAHVQAASLIGRMVPPDWSITGSLMQPLWDTINIATVGTALGVLIAFPLAFNFGPLPLPPSQRLRWELWIDGVREGDVAFESKGTTHQPG